MRQSVRGELVLKSSQFRRERERQWAELEEMVSAVEGAGLSALSAEDLARLPALYRAAASGLAVARAISLDAGLLAYLTGLVRRSYLVVYGTKRRAGAALVELFGARFPRTVRRLSHHVGAAALLLLLGVSTGYALVAADAERFYGLVPAGLAEDRNPAASTAALAATLYPKDEGLSGVLGVFATSLFTHNTGVGFFCFALGFAAAAPAALLLFYNGAILGAMAALFASRGLGSDFWGWVLPHGITELAAVCLCGAGGLALGTALLFPGEESRRERLRQVGREAVVLVLGSMALFLVAGLIEGIFRQLVTDPVLRWLVALASFGLLAAYLGLAGREREARDA